MWEYRLTWTSQPPAWWEKTWSHAVTHLETHGQPIEDPNRTDTYLVIPGRYDIGLKLRSGEKFEAKVLHQRRDGWELWEKCIFFEWNALEYARLISFLRSSSSVETVDSHLSAAEGSELVLRDQHVLTQKVEVKKTRVQATAAIVFKNVPEVMFNPTWLAEMVRIELPKRNDPIYSICFETMDPIRGGNNPGDSGGAICCGYPELLGRFLCGSF
jgi:hypothetical protein